MTLDEMWQRLEQHQPFANQRGYGPEWARMCEERTPEAAWAAGSDAAWAAWVAWVAKDAAWVAWSAAKDAAWAAADVTYRWSATGAASAVEWIEKAEGKN